MTEIRSENITRTKNIIKGYFVLSDKTKSYFRIDKEYGWQQWGNFRDNLVLTVDRVEKLQQELLEL